MDNVVESIFGLSPAQIQQRQNVGMMTAANNYAGQDPLQRAAASMFAGGGMLAGAGAQAAGMMTPDMQQAQMQQQATAGLDFNDPKAIYERASRIQDPRIRFGLTKMAQDRELELAKTAEQSTQAQYNLHRANAEANPVGKIDPSKYTPESLKAWFSGGMKNPSLLLAADKPQYESMSNEQKLVEAAADAKGLKVGSPERAVFVADAYQKLMDKRTHINVTTTGAQYNLSPEQQGALDKAVTEGRLDPARINSRSAIILANQFKLNPNLDMVSGTADAKTRTAQQSKVGVQLSVLRPFVGMVDKNGEVLKTLADKAIVTNVALANRPINWIEQNIGDHPDMAEFIAQVKIFKDEAARVVSNPNLVGVLSDTARKEMENVISGNMPLKSMRRVIERLQSDSHNRISTMEDEYASIRKQDKKSEVKSTATVSNW